MTTAEVSGPETTAADRARPIRQTAGTTTEVAIGTTSTVTETETETGTTDLLGTEATESHNQGLDSLASQKTRGSVCRRRQGCRKRR